MSSQQPFVPRRDHDFSQWAMSFAQIVSDDPGRYAISPTEAQALTQWAQTFADALRQASEPVTRTQVAVSEKDAARNSTEAFFRNIAALIRVNNGISDSDKIALGIRPRNTSWTHVNVPDTSPLLRIIAATPGMHTLAYADTFTPTSRAKPFGAACLHLVMDVSFDGQPPSLERAKFVGSFTRQPMLVHHVPEHRGRQATYWGRWANRRGEMGPWSLPVSFTIANGGGVGAVSGEGMEEGEGARRAG